MFQLRVCSSVYRSIARESLWDYFDAETKIQLGLFLILLELLIT